jgi:hypothetical protein
LKQAPDDLRKLVALQAFFSGLLRLSQQTSSSRFKEIGSLAGFLLAADFCYTGVITPPSVPEVGEIIQGFLDKSLSPAQKLHMVFDGIMAENSFSKSSRVVGDKHYHI